MRNNTKISQTYFSESSRIRPRTTFRSFSLYIMYIYVFAWNIYRLTDNIFADDYYFVWRRHENMPVCTGSRVNSNYERIASRVGARFRTRASGSQRHLPPPTVSPNVPNHSSMTQIGTSWTVSHIEHNSELIYELKHVLTQALKFFRLRLSLLRINSHGLILVVAPTVIHYRMYSA